MQKKLIPMIAALLLCGGAAGTLVMSASAQPVHDPVLIQPGDALVAQASAATGQPVHAPRGDTRARFADRLAGFCADHYARAVGRMAYLETRLALTPAQAPLFGRWKDVMLAQAKDRESACAARKIPDHMAGPPSPVDRMARQEERLKHRLASLDAQQPALAALFDSLTPRQKEALAETAREARHGMMARGMGPGMMGPGMMDRGFGGMGPGVMDHRMTEPHRGAPGGTAPAQPG